jgi:hypothetical protein
MPFVVDPRISSFDRPMPRRVWGCLSEMPLNKRLEESAGAAGPGAA